MLTYFDSVASPDNVWSKASRCLTSTLIRSSRQIWRVPQQFASTSGNLEGILGVFGKFPHVRGRKANRSCPLWEQSIAEIRCKCSRLELAEGVLLRKDEMTVAQHFWDFLQPRPEGDFVALRPIALASNGFCRFLTYCHPVASSGEVHLARVMWPCLKNQAQVHSAVSRRE
jgi:hypothetical protein